jgi:membrane protease YdiL (CAAX protease family)
MTTAQANLVTLDDRAQAMHPADALVPRRMGVLAVAWITTLLISRLPEIALREGLGIRTEWMPWALIASAALLWFASRIVKMLRPLAGYFRVMIAVTIMLAVIPVILGSGAWKILVPPSSGEMTVLLAERVLLGILAMLMIGFLFAMRTSRSEAYLVPGSISAASGIRLPWMKTPVRWSVIGPVWIVVLAVLTGLAMFGSVPRGIDLAAAVPLLGVAVVAAAINSFWEEVVFRAGPLSKLGSVIGPGPAVLLLAVWFGLGHYYGGIPSGAVGAVMAGSVGLLFGRAMIEMRGLAWPWALHFTSDLVIYAALALIATSSAI